MDSDSTTSAEQGATKDAPHQALELGSVKVTTLEGEAAMETSEEARSNTEKIIKLLMVLYAGCWLMILTSLFVLAHYLTFVAYSAWKVNEFGTFAHAKSFQQIYITGCTETDCY